MPGKIDVRGSEELRDLFLALQNVDRDTRKYLRQFARSKIAPAWVQEVKTTARTPLERQVIGNTATVTVSDQNVRVQAATKGRRLTGGLQPKIDWPAVEFGADQSKTTTYRRKGARVTRHTRRQLRPRNRSGYVFYPTADRMVPRLASLWVQTIVKGIANVFDGKAF